jgi:hypothetical protein
VVHGLAGLSLCVCIYIYICVCVYVYIYIYIYKSNMYLPLWARKCNEFLVHGCCNHFAVTADKGPCVVHGLAGLSVCIRVCTYIYMCVCVYLYIYI